MTLNSRETASVIIFTAMVLVVVASSRSRRDLAVTLGRVAQALAGRVVILTFVLYVAWVAAAVTLAWRVGLWGADQLKETILIALLVGVPLLFGCVSATDGAAISRRALSATLGVGALTAAYLNLAAFALGWELALQTVVLVLTLTVVVAESGVGQANGCASPAKIALGSIGLVVLVITAIEALRQNSRADWSGQFHDFALSVWLPLACLPLLYVLALLAALEMALLRISGRAPKDHTPLGVRIALVAGFRMRLLYARAFASQWIDRVAAANGYRQATMTMREYRYAIQEHRYAERRRLARLSTLAGVPGRGLEGWLDRREFAETKRLLSDVWMWAASAERSKGRYDAKALSDLLPREASLLPQDRPIVVEVSPDGNAWRAWRSTPGGYVFGTGGRRGSDQWEYDGPELPRTFPGESDHQWRDRQVEEASDEWAIDDDPIQLA